MSLFTVPPGRHHNKKTLSDRLRKYALCTQARAAPVCKNISMFKPLRTSSRGTGAGTGTGRRLFAWCFIFLLSCNNLFAGSPPAYNDASEARINSRIIELADDAEVPPEIIANTESAVIGGSIVRRLYEKFGGETLSDDVNYDFFANAQLQLAFPPSVIDGIREKGFLNQHQFAMPNTTGLYDPDKRRKFEDYLSGLNIEKTYSTDPDARAHYIRPKYAFLALKEPLLNFTPVVSAAHGSAFAVLKDRVKARATITPFDSFSAYRLSKTDWNKVRRTFFSKSVPAEFTEAASENGYWEAQIWGALTLEDVRYFLVNCGSVSPTAGEIEKLVRVAGSLAPKIPVYECADEKFPGGALKPGKQLNKLP